MKRAAIGVIVVVLAASAGLALRVLWGQGGDGDVHQRLVDALDELDAGDLTLVAEQQFGVPDCLLGDCPRVDRYYASPRGVSETCTAVTAAVTAWAPAATPSGEPGCELEGRAAGAHLSVSVRDTIEIEPEHDQVEPPTFDVRTSPSWSSASLPTAERSTGRDTGQALAWPVRSLYPPWDSNPEPAD